MGDRQAKRQRKTANRIARVLAQGNRLHLPGVDLCLGLYEHRTRLGLVGTRTADNMSYAVFVEVPPRWKSMDRAPTHLLEMVRFYFSRKPVGEI